MRACTQYNSFFFLIKLKLIHIRDASWVGCRLVQKRHLDNKEVEDKFSRNNMFLT